MLLSLFLFVVGLFFLVKGADWLVKGASAISLKLNIAPIVIGLTVVAFGTSAPELVVSLTSALQGNTEVALGNVIGSNIANTLLILGLSAVIGTLTIQRNTVWKEIPMSFLGAIVVTILGLQIVLDEGPLRLSFFSSEVIGSISLSNGLILLAFFIIFLYYTFGIAKTSGETAIDITKHTIPVAIGLVIIGLVTLAISSKITVDGAIAIARNFGVSETFIGLTLVALGTSLPELVTSIVATLKKNSDIAVGNIVGSNIYNIFFILGTTALVRPIPLRGINLSDIFVLLFATLYLFIFMFVFKRHQLNRTEGILMLTAYTLYICFLLYRETL